MSVKSTASFLLLVVLFVFGLFFYKHMNPARMHKFGGTLLNTPRIIDDFSFTGTKEF